MSVHCNTQSNNTLLSSYFHLQASVDQILAIEVNSLLASKPPETEYESFEGEWKLINFYTPNNISLRTLSIRTGKTCKVDIIF